MYAKVFASMLDSSIWLESNPTRIVWLTLLLSMDADGYAHFSTLENLASRARVTPEECNAAVTVLLSPDEHSGDPEHEGRRIERVPGGYMILNAEKYKDIASDVSRRESTRLRVKRFREKNDVTPCNALKQNVTVPYTYTCTSKEGECEGKDIRRIIPPPLELVTDYAKSRDALSHVEAFMDHFTANGWRVGGKSKMADWQASFRNWVRRSPEFNVQTKRRDAHI